MQNENLPQFVVTTNFRRIAGLKKRYRIVRGSAGASKTWGILALLINHCSSTANQKCIVIGRQLAKMKVGVVSDFVKLMKIFGLFRNDRWNSTTSLYSFPNDSTIQFYGTADDPMAGKGVRCNCLYADEINHIDFGAFRQFASRADVIYGSYNPDRISFVETELIPLEDCDFITVTYKGNEALGDAERSELDSYYDRAYNADGSVKSPYWENMYKVYVKGELGSVVGAIFTNIVTGEFDDSLPFVYGYDMGYSDEDGLVKVAVDKKNMVIYVKELIYQNNLSNADIVKLVKEKVGNGIVVCDSAAAKTVADFKQAKIRAVSCSKRKIVDDIKDMQSYKIVITPDSPNALREFKEWCWKDRDGKSIPEDGQLHCADSTRYALNYLTVAQPKPSSVVVTGNRRRSGGPVVSRLY